MESSCEKLCTGWSSSLSSVQTYAYNKRNTYMSSTWMSFKIWQKSTFHTAWSSHTLEARIIAPRTRRFQLLGLMSISAYVNNRSRYTWEWTHRGMSRDAQTAPDVVHTQVSWKPLVVNLYHCQPLPSWGLPFWGLLSTNRYLVIVTISFFKTIINSATHIRHFKKKRSAILLLTLTLTF